MAFRGITNTHVLSPQPTACSLSTVTRPAARFECTMPKKFEVDGGANRCHNLFIKPFIKSFYQQSMELGPVEKNANATKI